MAMKRVDWQRSVDGSFADGGRDVLTCRFFRRQRRRHPMNSVSKEELPEVEQDAEQAQKKCE